MKLSYRSLVHRLSYVLLGMLSYSSTSYANYVEDTEPKPIEARTYPRDQHPIDSSNPYRSQWASNLVQDVLQDFKHYVKPQRLWLLGGAFGSAAILANTGLDKSVHTYWQSHIRSQGTNRFFTIPQKIGGLSYYYAPIYLVTMGLGHLGDNTLMGNVAYHWGYRSLRTFLVGGPQQALFTYLLGSGRPNRGESSKWQPFKHHTGVSGHAFYGAIPFLTAAMMTDPPALRYAVYALSTLPGLARINSDYHYLSQVLLGWSMAYLSAASVYETDAGREPKFQVSVQPRSGGAMVHARMTF